MKKYLLNGNVIEPNQAFTHNGFQYQANWTQLASASEIAAIGMVEYVEPPTPPVIPESVSMRQARLALLANGLLDQIDEAIKSMDRAPQIEWEFASEVRRDSPLIAGLAAAFGLSSEQLDAMFVQAASL